MEPYRNGGVKRMMMNKAYTFRIYLNQTQAILINKMISCSRCVCKYFLSLWDSAYEETEKGLTTVRALPT